MPPVTRVGSPGMVPVFATPLTGRQAIKAKTSTARKTRPGIKTVNKASVRDGLLDGTMARSRQR